MTTPARATDLPRRGKRRTEGLPLFAERAPALHYLRFTSTEERRRYEAAYQEMVS